MAEDRRWDLEGRLQAALRAEERAGLALAVKVRLAALAVIGAWVAVRAVGTARVYYLAIIALFVLLALGHLALSRWRPRGAGAASFVLVLLEMMLLAATLVVPNPAAPPDWSEAMQLRLGNFDFFYILMAFAVLSFSPVLALWAGLATALAWSAGVLWVLSRPDSFTAFGGTLLEQSDYIGQLKAVLLDPDYVSMEIWIQQVITALVVAAILAVAVRRSRRLALRQAALARERANLARYFSPDRAEALARADEPVGAVREQPVAILFADLVGFTRLCEGMAPEQVVALLRGFHARMAAAVFEHGGTLEKYTGDGVMATFGTPRTSPDDPLRALACGRAMLAAIATWNAERKRRGERPLRIGIGAHIGQVVLGDIGDERCMEFAVLGDPVNVASRLERLSRRLEVELVASDDLVRSARERGAGALLSGLVQADPQILRGRREPLVIWTLRQAAAAPAPTGPA